MGIWLWFGGAQNVWSQATSQKIDRVDIKFVGPSTISEQYVRANIHLKAGDTYIPGSTQDDIQALYATGLFYNIRVSVDQANDGGVNLTYILQPRPRLTEIRLEGNKKLSDSKLKKKITVKVGDPLDEQKLFMDVQEMKKLYEKYGYPDTQIKYVVNIDEANGTGSVVFQITETPKVKITQIEFVGAKAFSQKELRKQLKTKKRWMFSWLTGSGYFKQEDFDDDKDALVQFYREHGYLDFEIKDVKLEHPEKNRLAIVFYVFEGRQYKVGSVKFTGNNAFSDAQIRQGLVAVHDFQHSKAKLGANGLPMDVGDIFTPEGLRNDMQAMEDFYGSKGYIGVAQGQGLSINRIPNVDTGTMDLEFQIDEGQKTYVEKIDIRGNVKTKDKVIRRELAISPGDVFDMVRVKISQERLEGLQYFDKVDLEPEPTEPPIAGHENLVVNVEEQNTGNLTFGAGYSSVDALVGYVELSQGNFDLFHPPYFTGAGQKFRLRLQLGTQRQDYEMQFIEPWFLGKKLQFGVDIYRHELDFESPHNIFNETRTGFGLSLTRALPRPIILDKLLGPGDFNGTISYTLEDVGISLNPGWHGPLNTLPFPTPRNVPQAILDETGDHLYQRFGGKLSYDTRNSTELPNHGQYTELSAEFSSGNKKYYKAEAKTDWFFPGLHKGHVLEASGRVSIADSLSGSDVPFYDRYYLGGLDSLRGFKYRNIAPREPFDPLAPDVPNEPIGGDSLWFGSLEYTIPILEKDNGLGVRFALFYDIGAVSAAPYSFSGSFDDNWGIGLHLNIPRLGPLRIEYGVPINHDKYNSSSGQFQFSVGYTRPF